MRDPMKEPPYRVVLCRFDEINLKSPQYQSRLVDILKDHIVKLCKREEIPLQSLKHYHGGLIAYFPEEDFKKALSIFPFISGIHSYSPALNTPRKMKILLQNVEKYIVNSIEEEDSVRVQYKNFVEPMDSAQLEGEERRIQSHVDTCLARKGFPTAPSQQKEHIFINIEVREEGTFIFHEKLTSLLGGLPLETNNAMIAIYSLDKPAIVGIFLNACILMLRRGAIISPIVFIQENINNPQIMETLLGRLKSDLVLQELSRYYPEDVTVLIAPLGEIHPSLETHITSCYTDEVRPRMMNAYTHYLHGKILESIIKKSRRRNFTTYGERKLHYKAVISTFSPEKDYSRILLHKKMDIPFVYPLSGLDPGLPQDFINRLPIPSDPIVFSENRDFQLESPQIKEIEAFFSKPLIVRILEKIVHEMKLYKRSSSILSSSPF